LNFKNIAIIPARGGSKRIPKKNVTDFLGKPIIAYSIEMAISCKLFNKVIVSTDDDEIAAHAEHCGVEVPFRRPKEISDDNALTIDVVLHALNALGEEFDAVMVLQPTSPLRTASDIDACLKMLSESSADSVISVVNVGGHHPARMKFIESGFLIDPPFAEEYQPRQNLRSVFIRNGAIYLTRVSVLRSRSFEGKNCLAYEMPSERSVNIDTFTDLKIAEFLGLLR
jgi:CMP-N-acetylneuraminic acid synthetase